MMRNRREWRSWRDQLLAPEHAPERIWEAQDSFRDVCQICGQRWPCRSASSETTTEEEPA